MASIKLHFYFLLLASVVEFPSPFICFNNLTLCLQVDSDDVITKDEQIYILIGAHARCERNIQTQMALVKGTALILITIKYKAPEKYFPNPH